MIIDNLTFAAAILVVIVSVFLLSTGSPYRYTNNSKPRNNSSKH